MTLPIRYLAAVAALAFFAGCKAAPEPGRGAQTSEAKSQVASEVGSDLEERARTVTALAAVLEAAVQVAEPASLETFRRFSIAQSTWPSVEDAYPERQALAVAVQAWPRERKQAALDWVRVNATWTTQLHALAIESFGPDFEPLEWGPTMSRFDPAIFSRREGLAPLLRAALEDEAIARIAAGLAAPRSPFTAAEVAERRARLIQYLRIPDDLPPYAALYDTLLQPTNGVNAFLPDGSILFVVGPSGHPPDLSMVLFHEMAHPPIHRILQQPDVGAALQRSQCVFDATRDNKGYSSWPSFFAEALARSLSYRLQGIPALDTGFVFEGWLTERLAHWERTPDQRFPDAVVAILEALPERHCRQAASDAR